MKITLEKAVALLPFAFMLHNSEEAWGISKLSTSFSFPMHQGVTPLQFAIAVTLFTVLGFVIIFIKSLYKSEKQYTYVTTGFTGMLFLNVFFPHLIATIFFGQYAPGVITALLINLPLTGYILFATFKTNKLNLKQIITASTIGALIGIMLVFIFLKIGNIVLNI